MSRDINCSKCGEPYSQYSLHNEIPEWEDQPDDAYERFMSGDGCPCCDWGEKAGDVSLSREMSEEELEAKHFVGMMENTDDDPIKYI